MSHSAFGDGVLRYKGRLCAPNVNGLRNRSFEEAHGSRFSFHLVGKKMNYDLTEVFWWEGLKRKKRKLLQSVSMANK